MNFISNIIYTLNVKGFHLHTFKRKHTHAENLSGSLLPVGIIGGHGFALTGSQSLLLCIVMLIYLHDYSGLAFSLQ